MTALQNILSATTTKELVIITKRVKHMETNIYESKNENKRRHDEDENRDTSLFEDFEKCFSLTTPINTYTFCY